MWEGEDDIISEIKKKLQNSQEKTHSNKNFIRDIEERQKNNHQMKKAGCMLDYIQENYVNKNRDCMKKDWKE